uniref:putative nuclease HARBI1 n=1 Tax=Epinephelus lanceolatus TaxID=310571 RepID=UPI0014474550|nr:putative nuclease HARBI1 [Epinephelus lanceolatus]
MVDLALLEDIAARAFRRERIFRDHQNMFDEGEEWLMSRFRLPRHVLLELCNSLEPHLQHPTHCSHPVPPQVQVLSTLGFLATGTFQREIADRAGISQPTLSRVIPKVLNGIIRQMPIVLKFLYDERRQSEVKRGLHGIAGMPNTVGAIDCTHVRIKAPSTNSMQFMNRKNYHSINVQVICDADCRILNFVARWPGGTHNSFILRNSGSAFEAGAVRDGWLVGDRGYGLKTWLMTPFANPQTPQEVRYNTIHVHTRSVIERTFGQLKGRWMCLDTAGAIAHGIPIPAVAEPQPEEDAQPNESQLIANNLIRKDAGRLTTFRERLGSGWRDGVILRFTIIGA